MPSLCGAATCGGCTLMLTAQPSHSSNKVRRGNPCHCCGRSNQRTAGFLKTRNKREQLTAGGVGVVAHRLHVSRTSGSTSCQLQQHPSPGKVKRSMADQHSPLPAGTCQTTPQNCPAYQRTK